MDARIIGDRLRELRGSKSQDSIAKDLEISRSAYAMYEQGNRIPRDEVKIRIAEYYGKSVGEIFLVNSARNVYKEKEES